MAGKDTDPEGHSIGGALVLIGGLLALLDASLFGIKLASAPYGGVKVISIIGGQTVISVGTAQAVIGISAILAIICVILGATIFRSSTKPRTIGAIICGGLIAFGFGLGYGIAIIGGLVSIAGGIVGYPRKETTTQPPRKAPARRAEPETGADKMVFDYIQDHGGEISISRASKDLGLSEKELKSIIKRLKRKGRLEEM